MCNSCNKFNKSSNILVPFLYLIDFHYVVLYLLKLFLSCRSLVSHSLIFLILEIWFLTFPFLSDFAKKPFSHPIPSQVGMTSQSFHTYGYQGASKKIEIPNGRVCFPFALVLYFSYVMKQIFSKHSCAVLLFWRFWICILWVFIRLA